MNSVAFRFGVFAGTALRECLRSARHKSTSAPVASKPTPTLLQLPQPHLSDAEINDLCHVPAIVRSGVNLNDWFLANTHECKAKTRKPRRRGNVVINVDAATESTRFGSLNELIA